jgi:hypothetical protein
MPASAKHKKKSAAIQSRHRKVFYLPLERPLANQVILQFRMAIEVVRSGHADKAAARKLLQVTLLTGFINEAGFGMIEQSIIDRTERALSEAFTRNRETGEWLFGPELIDDLTAIVNEHDRQLRETRLQVVAEASERLDRLIENSGSIAAVLTHSPRGDAA